jgi:hypothetical protein
MPGKRAYLTSEIQPTPQKSPVLRVTVPDEESLIHSQLLSISFRLGSYVFQHAQMNPMNDVV